VYGVPGGAISPIYDALVDEQAIRVVHVRHETNALFMAIGHTRMQPGSLPCVLVTSGPGVTNTVTGLAAAIGEGVPVMVLGGEVPRSRFGRRALQEGSPDGIDVVSLVRTVTRSASMVGLAAHAEVQVAAAADRARAMRGPVFLSLPLDVAVAPATGTAFLRRALPPLAPDPTAIAAAAIALRNAERPLVLVGSGARGASRAVTQLAERLRIPVVTSPKAKGVVPDSSPMCLGVFGYAGHPSASEHLQACPPDVVLALGCGFSEPSTNSWSPALQATKTMIQVDLDPSQLGRNYRADLAIQAECELAVEAIDAALGDRGAWATPDLAVTYYEPEAARSDRLPLSPARVVTVLQEEVPEDTIFTADIGEHLLFAIHYLRATHPDQLVASLSFGSMGSGIGAAIGAKLVAPERRVVALCGDYGFQMYGMELATCVQEGLDVVFVVMNDSRMRMVEAGMKRIYRRTMAMDGPPVDFAAIARAHGAAGYVAHDATELRRAVRQARGPVVIDVRIDPEASFPVNARAQEISNWSAR
jgi:acetolactate synthase-1/2/3 large subunit